MRHSRLFQGTVRHRRHEDARHAFRYRLDLVLLDLDEASALSGFLPWGGKPWAPRSFCRKDYFAPESTDLKAAVQDRVEEDLGFRPEGRILLLTQLRSFGYLFMPVSFYLCHDAEDRLVAVVAEITNTPWHERHAYVLDARAEDPQAPRHWEFEKVFHVSPFHGMDHLYRWTLQLRGDRLVVAMENERDGRKVFDATLAGRLHPWTRSGVARQAWRSPFQSQRIHFAIYVQALRLFLKRATFHRHPKKSAIPASENSHENHARFHSS
ncbi:MAG: DUF1365 domain-containing protein [Planctomycetota bacterium]